MTTFDLLKQQLDDSGYQLEQVFAGLSEEQAGFKAAPSLMSAREMVDHLAECYVAAKKEMAGESHSWGTFDLGANDFQSAYDATMGLRGEAITSVLTGDESKAAHAGSAYIVLHDAYHVGQMCANRLAIDPNWNAYSIYKM